MVGRDLKGYCALQRQYQVSIPDRYLSNLFLKANVRNSMNSINKSVPVLKYHYVRNSVLTEISCDILSQPSLVLPLVNIKKN